MRSAYTVLYLSAERALLRAASGSCANLQDAIAFALLEGGLCELLKIYAEGRLVWSGTPTEASAMLSASNQAAADPAQV